MRSRVVPSRLSVLFCVLFATTTGLSDARAKDKTPPPNADTKSRIDQRREELAQETELLRLFAETLEQIQANYVDEGLSEKELIEAAIQGMMSKLDPYSNYIRQDDVEQFRRGMEPYAGIGVEVTQRGGTIQIVRAFLNYSAWKAGLRAGDQITKIGDRETKDLSLTEAVKLMSGKPGSKVTITVLHAATRRTDAMELTREVTRRPMVVGFDREKDGSWNYFFDRDNKLAYARISTFGRGTGDALRQVLGQLDKQKFRGLVIDLRFNPGGLLTEAFAVCDQFVAEGKIVSTKGRTVPSQTWTAHKSGTLVAKDFPVAVLVNRYSASAAEIVSACLQDHEVALVIGERTWGKGSVQNVISLDRGKSAMKLTTATYLRPSGKNIHRLPGASPEEDWGVRPDDSYELRLPMREMVLLGRHLQEEENFSAADDANQAPFEDRQLDMARNYLLAELGVPPKSPPKEAQEPATSDPSPAKSKKEDHSKPEKKKPEKKKERT